MSLRPAASAATSRPLHTPGRLRLVVGLLAATAALSGCTARMDMEIKASGTFDAVIEMRDTTGTVFDAVPDCSPYSSPEALGITGSSGAQVSARPLTGAEGSGCEVTVTDVPVMEVSATNGTPGTEGGQPLVVREGDLFKVSLPPLTAPAPSPAPTTGGTPGADPGAAPDGGQPATPPAPPAGGEAQAPTGSLAQLVSTHLQITFPGAVVDGGGGLVEGRTVTWSDPEVLADGVQATGLAEAGAGLSLWDRFKSWIAVGLTSAVLVTAVLVLRRRGRGHRSRRASQP